MKFLTKKEKEKKEINKINPRSTFVNLEKEYDEDRELLELLISTNKSKQIYSYNFEYLLS